MSDERLPYPEEGFGESHICLQYEPSSNDNCGDANVTWLCERVTEYDKDSYSPKMYIHGLTLYFGRIELLYPLRLAIKDGKISEKTRERLFIIKSISKKDAPDRPWGTPDRFMGYLTLDKKGNLVGSQHNFFEDPTCYYLPKLLTRRGK